MEQKSLSISVFNTKVICSDMSKLTALDYYDGNLFVGDEKGILHIYTFNLEAFKVEPTSKKEIQVGKGKIESIKILSNCNNILVQVEGMLICVSLTDYNYKQTVHKNKIAFFEINQKTQNQIFLMEKKEKKGVVIEFDTQNPYGFRPIQKTGSFPYLPNQIQFLEELVFYSFNKKEYANIDILSQDGKTKSCNVTIPSNGISLIQIINDSEILYQTENGISVFLGKYGNPIQKNTLKLPPNEQVLFCKVKDPYLIVAYEKYIKVYNIHNGIEMQELTTQNGKPLKGLSITGNQLFYQTSKDICYLQLTKYETLLKRYFEEGKIEEAKITFESNVSKDDPERNSKQEEFYIRATWALIKQCKWEKAKQTIIQNNLNMDLREIVFLFTDLIPKYIDYPSTKQSQNFIKKNEVLDQIIKSHLQDGTKNPSKLNDEMIQEKRKSEAFLADILLNFKKTYSKDNQNEQGFNFLEQLNFRSCPDMSAYGEIVKKTNADELRKLFDCVLLKIYIKQGRIDELRRILFQDSNDLMCQDHYENLRDDLMQKLNKKEHYETIALFYESFTQYKDALEIWKDIGKDQSRIDRKLQEKACDQTIKILSKVKDKNTIKRYLQWVLQYDIKKGSKVFKDLPDNFYPEQMMDYFQNDLYQEKNYSQQEIANNIKAVKERYLEVLVHDKKIQEEKYHTQLAQLYIKEYLFSEYPAQTDMKQINKDNYIVNEYRGKLMKLLTSPKSMYNSSILLNDIKDSWLFDETIELYSKEKRHKEAIHQFLKVKDPQISKAEQYCESRQGKLLTVLFEMMVTKYEKATSDKEVQKQYIFNFLKKYATNSQLDQVKVLQLLPQDTLLNNEGKDDGLYSFISAAISHTLHEKRSIKSAKYLSQMDKLNVETNLVKYKQAYYKVAKESKCFSCNKHIQTKNFVVFPNGIIADYNCAQKKGMQICPKTGQDFSKTFRGI